MFERGQKDDLAEVERDGGAGNKEKAELERRQVDDRDGEIVEMLGLRPTRDVKRGVRGVPLLSQFISPFQGRAIARSTRVERVAGVRLLRGFRAMEFKPGIREEAAPASSSPQRVARDREEQKELRERATPGRERGSQGVQSAQQRQQRLVGQRDVEQESGQRRRCSSSKIRREEAADLLHERLKKGKVEFGFPSCNRVQRNFQGFSFFFTGGRRYSR